MDLFYSYVIDACCYVMLCSSKITIGVTFEWYVNNIFDSFLIDVDTKLLQIMNLVVSKLA